MRTRPIRRFVGAPCTAFLVLVLGACDLLKDESADAEANEASADAAKDARPATAAAKPDTRPNLVFDAEDKSIRKAGCELLTAEMVSEHFDVPAADLEQRKLLGCMYNWKSDDEILEARVSQIRAHKDLERAKLWFGKATASKTKEELQAEMDMVKGKAEAGDEKAVDRIVEVAKMGTGEDGIRYDDVPGIGDAARASSADGTLWIRVGNLTLSVAAYKGPPQPDIDINLKDAKGVAKAAMEAQTKFLAETQPQRLEAAKALAPGIIAAVSKRASG